MRKLFAILAVMLFVLSSMAMADSLQVTGTGPQLVATGGDYVVTGIWSATVSGAGSLEIIATAATYTAGTTVLTMVNTIDSSSLLNKYIDLTSVYHYLENNPRLQWNNGTETLNRKDVNLECEDGIVVDFNTTTGTVTVFYEKKAVKQADVNYTNAE